MDKWTKENPGCYHAMIRHMADITGESLTESIIVHDVEELYYVTKSHKPKKKLKYKSRNIKVLTMDNEIVNFMVGCRRFDDVGIVSRHFLVERNKNHSQFNVNIEYAGYYKDSLGGGWYNKVPMYKVGDYYFASMDCSC